MLRNLCKSTYTLNGLLKAEGFLKEFEPENGSKVFGSRQRFVIKLKAEMRLRHVTPPL